MGGDTARRVGPSGSLTALQAALDEVGLHPIQPGGQASDDGVAVSSENRFAPSERGGDPGART